nr:MAG TPA: hypothetical protein [Caudoviricetes sp.]
MTYLIRLVGTYHGQRMYVFGFVRSGQRDNPMETGGCGVSGWLYR